MNVYYPLLKLFWKRVERHDRARLGRAVVREDTAVAKDIPYCADGRDGHLLDVYLPDDGGDSPLPVIVSIHGGGWMYGAKENNLDLCTVLALRGFAVFNINYTLAPRASIGDMLDDIMLAFGFIGGNAEKFRADTSRVFLLGDSAGAQLSLYASAIANCDRVRNVFGIADVPFGVSALALISPVCFIGRGIGPVAANHRIALTGDFAKAHRGHMDPAFLFDSGAVCPAFMTTSAGDRLGRRQTMRLAGMYEKYGIKHVFDHAPDKKLGHVYPLHTPDSAQTRKVLERMCAFFGEI